MLGQPDRASLINGSLGCFDHHRIRPPNQQERAPRRRPSPV